MSADYTQGRQTAPIATFSTAYFIYLTADDYLQVHALLLLELKLHAAMHAAAAVLRNRQSRCISCISEATDPACMRS